MSFGSKSKSEKKEPKPQIVVSPGSGSGLTDGQATAATQQRTEAATPQTSLLTQNDQNEDDLLKKGIG